MRKTIGLVLFLAGCGSGVMVANPTPFLLLGPPNGWPLAAGDKLRVLTRWAGQCRVPTRFPFTLLGNKVAAYSDESCDAQPYALAIRCAYRCRITSADGIDVFDHYLSYVAPDAGDRAFLIAPLAARVRVKVTMTTYGGATETRETLDEAVAPAR